VMWKVGTRTTSLDIDSSKGNPDLENLGSLCGCREKKSRCFFRVSIVIVGPSNDCQLIKAMLHVNEGLLICWLIRPKQQLCELKRPRAEPLSASASQPSALTG